MAVQREIVGDVEEYRGRVLAARFMGPDLLGYVDETELSGFFRTAEAARAAGRRYVDEEDKARAEGRLR